jgi:Putative zinc-finger
MSMGSHPREELAAIALGAIEPTDEAEVRQHLKVCPSCVEALNQLRGIRTALTAVPDEAWPSPPRPSDVTLMQLLRRLRRERQRTRRRLIGTAIASGAAAAAVVALAVVLSLFGSRTTEATPEVPQVAPQARTWQFRGTDAATDVTGAATVVNASWGSKIYLELHGVPRGDQCRLVVYDDSGNRWAAGSWTVTPGSEFYWSGGVAVPGNRIAKVAVVTTHGQHLLSMS